MLESFNINTDLVCKTCVCTGTEHEYIKIEIILIEQGKPRI